MSAHATHQTTLIEAMAATSGPVLELGSGAFSTRILHELCRQQGRPLVTFDNRHDWLDRYADLRCDWHNLKLVADWKDAEFGGVPFGLVFVDHAPAERRAVEIKRLIDAGLAETFVIHDTESPEYGYDEVWPLFASIDTRQAERPWTSICHTARGNRMSDEQRIAELEAKANALQKQIAATLPEPVGILPELASKIEDAIADAGDADGFTILVASSRGDTVTTFEATQRFPTVRILDVVASYLASLRGKPDAA